MGRRARARERAATEAVARPEATAPARGQGGRRWLRLLNPFKFRRLTRSRARYGAIGFGLSAVLFTVLGWLTGQPSWFSSAVLLAILALVWGVAAVIVGESDQSG